ncbi:MAG TPA: hypothetical protein VF931_03090, partial [Steroidobacteraceae bacterium]
MVKPGNVESIAVSSVQSMNAPLPSNKRRLGMSCPETAGIAEGRSNALRPPLPLVNASPGLMLVFAPALVPKFGLTFSDEADSAVGGSAVDRWRANTS